MAAILAADAAMASMVSTIPVVVIGGVVYKMSEAMLPKPGQSIQTVGKKQAKKVKIYGRDYSGDFSNVGF
jgi:hypothetical protein